jgi:hypothetical protein
LLNGVVTDNEHHGVKDLVAMIEKNTKWLKYLYSRLLSLDLSLLLNWKYQKF